MYGRIICRGRVLAVPAPVLRLQTNSNQAARFLVGYNSGRSGVGRALMGGCWTQPMSIVCRHTFQQRRWYPLPHPRGAPPAAHPTRTIWNILFGKYLLATNVLSSGLLMVAGDLMAQEIELRNGMKQEKQFDLMRVGRMFVVGALQGPLHHYVYNWMDRIMPVVNMRNTITKILIDQVFMSPACILIFFYAACYLENKTLHETNCEIISKFPFIYLMDWILWPAAQYVNFRYLETKYRVIFVNVCTMLYNVFMSYMKHDVKSADCG